MVVFIPKWCHILWTLPVSCDKSMESTSRIWVLSGLRGLHRSFHMVFLERSTALVGYQKQPQPDSSPYSWAQNIWEGSPRGAVSWSMACWEVVSADQRSAGRWCQLTSGLLGDSVSWPVVCWEVLSADQWSAGRWCQLTSDVCFFCVVFIFQSSVWLKIALVYLITKFQVGEYPIPHKIATVLKNN